MLFLQIYKFLQIELCYFLHNAEDLALKTTEMIFNDRACHIQPCYTKITFSSKCQLEPCYSRMTIYPINLTIYIRHIIKDKS